jgi:hypothetical protein
MENSRLEKTSNAGKVSCNSAFFSLGAEAASSIERSIKIKQPQKKKTSIMYHANKQLDINNLDKIQETRAVVSSCHTSLYKVESFCQHVLYEWNIVFHHHYRDN